MTGKRLTHREAARLVLATVFARPELFPAFEVGVHTGQFSHRAHRTIWRTLRVVADEHQPVDVTTVRHRLATIAKRRPDVDRAMGGLAGILPADDPEFLLDEFLRLSVIYRFRQRLDSIGRDLDRHAASREDLEAAFDELAFELFGHHAIPKSAAEIMNEVMAVASTRPPVARAAPTGSVRRIVFGSNAHLQEFIAETLRATSDRGSSDEALVLALDDDIDLREILLRALDDEADQSLEGDLPAATIDAAVRLAEADIWLVPTSNAPLNALRAAVARCRSQIGPGRSLSVVARGTMLEASNDLWLMRRIAAAHRAEVHLVDVSPGPLVPLRPIQKVSLSECE